MADLMVVSILSPETWYQIDNSYIIKSTTNEYSMDTVVSCHNTVNML